MNEQYNAGSEWAKGYSLYCSVRITGKGNPIQSYIKNVEFKY